MMKSTPSWPKISTVALVAFFTIHANPTNERPLSEKKGPSTSPAQQFTNSSFCSAPEYRQFDFWVGDWDVSDVDKPEIVARAQVDRMLDGCVLREDYHGPNGMEGQSFSIYDASRKVWQQTWVTNRGKLLVIEGNLQGSEMVLSGVDHQRADQQVRGTWKPPALTPANGGVRETAVISTDGGKTWQPWFDLMFRPHKP
jgi:hypothetical protein